MFIENCADNNNATLGHNWFLNIANYLHERKNMNIKIMDSRNKICCPICFLYIYSYFLFLINQYIKPSATRKPPRMQRKMILSVPSNIGYPAKVRSPYHTVMKIKNTAIKTASKPWCSWRYLIPTIIINIARAAQSHTYIFWRNSPIKFTLKHYW